jgi:hypothetical protein
MANPDIAAALVVLDAHLVAAGAALTEDMNDVGLGLPTGGRQLRYYYAGECEPPRMAGPRVLNGEMVGQRFIIAALWPIPDLSPATVASIDAEERQLAGEIRTRIQGDSTLGGNVTDLDLGYMEPDLVIITGTRYVACKWQLDLAYVEYTVAA